VQNIAQLDVIKGTRSKKTHT